MKMYYIAAMGNASDFRDGEVKEVRARSAEAAAIEEANILFESGDFDRMSPLTVIVAEDKSGKNAMLFTISRYEEVSYTIDGECEIGIPTDDSEED